MKTIKRKFLDSDETLMFNKVNRFSITRYFNSNHFVKFNNDILNLWFDHTYDKYVSEIKIEAIYFDYSKDIKKYEALESVDIINVPIPENGILKDNEFSIPIKTKVGTEILWKLIFKVERETDFDIHISIN